MKKVFSSFTDQKIIGIKLFIFICLLFIISFLIGGCTDNCEIKNEYIYLEPVYTSMEEIRASIDIIEPRDINRAGKIFFKDNFLFINEPNEGIHVINNHDPADPVPTAFITVPGSFDLAIKGNILFTDSYIDLVAIDISDLGAVREVGRIEKLFDNYNSYGYYADDQLGVVTDWQEVRKVEIYESDCAGGINPWGGLFYDRGIALAESSNTASFDAVAAVSPSNPGVGGSMARFALSGDYLYTIDMNDLQPVDIANPANMTAGSRIYIDWGIETIFPNEDVLFIGAQAGMYIMDISSPLNPTQISNYQHIRSCDPVIVDGDLAYVTLRSGSSCQGFTNQLEVIDISNLSSPELLHIYAMDNPHGLGKDGDALFICDGASGLKIYNASDASTIDENQLAHYANIKAFDIIPFNDVAMMIGEDGLYQYDYSDLNDIKFLSHIQVYNDKR